MSETSALGNLVNNVKDFLNSRRTKTHQDIEHSIRTGFVEFADILANSPPMKYNKLHQLNTYYMNQDLEGGGFHEEFMASLTICLLAYLKTVKDEENRQDKILKYLNTLLDVNMNEEDMYDFPNDIEKLYDY